MRIEIWGCSNLNFLRWKFSACSVELHFNTLLHKIYDWFVDYSDSVHRMPLTGSQLIYCISDRDITKQIMPDTLSIMRICWPLVVKCCPRAFGIRHNLYNVASKTINTYNVPGVHAKLLVSNVMNDARHQCGRHNWPQLSKQITVTDQWKHYSQLTVITLVAAIIMAQLNTAWCYQWCCNQSKSKCKCTLDIKPEKLVSRALTYDTHHRQFTCYPRVYKSMNEKNHAFPAEAGCHLPTLEGCQAELTQLAGYTPRRFTHS